MKRSEHLTLRPFQAAAIGLSLSLFPVGCSHYVEPTADRTDAAVLIGRNGAYITRVDGDDVASAKKVTADNGNRVRVLGGLPHQLQVSVVGTHPAVWNFKLDTDRGGTYVIEPQPGANLALGVTDQATGKQIPVK